MRNPNQFRKTATKHDQNRNEGRGLDDFFGYSLARDIEREWRRCHRDFDDLIAEAEEELQGTLDVKDHPKETP